MRHDPPGAPAHPARHLSRRSLAGLAGSGPVLGEGALPVALAELRGARCRPPDPTRRTGAPGGSLRRREAPSPVRRSGERVFPTVRAGGRVGRAAAGPVGGPGFRPAPGEGCRSRSSPARASSRVVNIPAQSCGRARTAAPRFRRGASGDGDSDCDSDRSRVRPACSPFPENRTGGGPIGGAFPGTPAKQGAAGRRKGAPPLPGPERRRPPVRAAAPSPPPVVRSRLP